MVSDERSGLNIVYLTTEAIPFAKTGGLADVCGTLPLEMAALGHRCSVIMPAFASIRRSSQPIESTDISFAIPMSGSKLVGCRLLRSTLPSGHRAGGSAPVPVWFIDQPQYFDRPNLYGDGGVDYPDNAERFIFFCRAAIAAMARIDADVDVIHCNDWQTGLVPALLSSPDDRPARLRDAATVMTVHNLAYQGNYGSDQFPWTGLGWDRFRPESFEYYGQLNFLKTGIVTADAVTTVSPTYAEEIKTPSQGCGLDPILRGIGDHVSGIINGIDPAIWNPATDPHLVKNFDAETFESAKIDNKLALQAEVGLPQDPDVPLIGLIGRLADQKGWDLILPVLRRHLEQRRPTQWVVLGTGDAGIEDALKQLAGRHRDQLAAYIGFSDALAHRIEASADLFVMPSRYEPCGLNQLYSLRYGTVCVVTPTGGLADTIVHAQETTLADDTATGFRLTTYRVDALDDAIGSALRMRYHDKKNWKKLVARGMRQNWSWRKSAVQYLDLYERTVALSRMAHDATPIDQPLSRPEVAKSGAKRAER